MEETHFRQRQNRRKIVRQDAALYVPESTEAKGIWKRGRSSDYESLEADSI